MDFADDEFWVRYEAASQAHQRALAKRVEAERELGRNLAEKTLVQWNEAHREEDKCYEELKAAERVLWAKYKNG